jgi:hypothetical protein
MYGAGRICFFSEKNLTTVIEPGWEFKVLTENQLEERVMATPAVTGDAIILRSHTGRLYFEHALLVSDVMVTIELAWPNKRPTD